MGLEPLAEVVHADETVGDGQNNEDDGENGEGSQGTADGKVVLAVTWLIDTDKLEEEVGKAAKVEQNNEAGAEAVFALGEKGGTQQDSNGDWDGGNVQAELDILQAVNDDEELNGEAEEEEKIELEQGDVNLLRKKGSLVSRPRDMQADAKQSQLTW